MLQSAVREGNYRKFMEYTKMVDEERTANLRGLMEFVPPEQGIPLALVESE